jgi:hypothetical protein
MILGKLEVELRTPPSAGAKFRFAGKNEAARAADAAACLDTSVGIALLKNGWCRR